MNSWTVFQGASSRTTRTTGSAETRAIGANWFSSYGGLFPCRRSASAITEMDESAISRVYPPRLALATQALPVAPAAPGLFSMMMGCCRTPMNVLSIDPSCDFCAVAGRRGAALVSRHEPAGRRQAERILDMVGEVLAEARLEIAEIEGIAYGAGPGSFTGLRIAAGVTQGLPLPRAIRVRGGGTLLPPGELTGR